MKSRYQILGVILQRENLGPLAEIDSLVREMEGYSQSDLCSLCSKAALIWAIERSKRDPAGVPSDESNMMLLQLTHFARALQRIQPSVSERDLLELESFGSTCIRSQEVTVLRASISSIDQSRFFKSSQAVEFCRHVS